MGTFFFGGLARTKISVTRFGVEQSGQQDVAESVEADAVQVIVGEVQFETPAEILDSLLQLRSLQRGDGRGCSFKTPT